MKKSTVHSPRSTVMQKCPVDYCLTKEMPVKVLNKRAVVCGPWSVDF